MPVISFRVFLLFALLSLKFATGLAQSYLSSNQAYTNVQNMRSDARKLWNRPDATQNDFDLSIKLLTGSIKYLDSLPIHDLGQGNLFLKARKHDVYFDLILASLKAKRYDEALTALEKMSDQGSYSWISDLEKDLIYAPLRSSPRFIAVINTLKNREALWTDAALATKYEKQITPEEKIAGLSLLWSQAKYNFVNFDHSGIDWDKTYLQYLSLIKESSTTADYYKILQKFYAELKDGHTNVYPPNELSGFFYSRPPFRTELIEGKVFITEVFSEILKQENLTPGTEILKINSEPVISFGKKFVEPYQSSSTPQDLQVRTYTYALLSGDSAAPLTLELKSTSGKVWLKTINRTGYHDLKPTPGFDFKIINNIGFLTINNFENPSISKQFDSIYSSLSSTKGLVIDLRKNGGGSSGIGFQILQYLTDTAFQTATSRFLKYHSWPGVGMQWDEYSPGVVKPNGKKFYSKPVVVLTSARTFSAAEDFVMAFDYMKRGMLIGQTTGGSTGQPISFNLPGGGTARVCIKSDTYPDGKKFVGLGIQPNIVVSPSINDLLSDTDAAAKMAIEVINKQAKE